MSNYYLLFYETIENYEETRKAFRREHLELAHAAADRGELLLGGALADPLDQALLVFRGASPEVARRFAEADPYVRQGLVRRWTIRNWTPVTGSLLNLPAESSGE